MLSLCLQADGVDVIVAADGEAGLALMRDRPVDVVVTDLFMPDKDGIETIVELKKRYPTSRSSSCRVSPPSAAPTISGSPASWAR